MIFFFQDSLIALDDLRPTKKKALKKLSIKYRVTDQYIERGYKTAKCLFLYKIFSILKWANDE